MAEGVEETAAEVEEEGGRGGSASKPVNKGKGSIVSGASGTKMTFDD